MAVKKKPFDQQRRYKKPRRKGRVLKVLFLLLLLVFLLASGAAASVVYNYAIEAPPLDRSRLMTVETSYLYDKHGNEVTALHDEQNRIVVSLNDIPTHVRDAFIAIEDERFYTHFGFDITGSLRAAYANFQAGSIVQGASTITQQLAQNAFLTTETSYERKIQEIWLAIQLERNYGKDEILEMYLNRIYFGNGAYGVEAAALTYFGKSSADLSIAEAAMLAGAVKSPNYFNAFDNRAEAENRMLVVLSSMMRLELISEAQYRQALDQRLTYADPPSIDYPYPHFVDYVIHHELIKILSEMPEIGSREAAYEIMYTGGLRIHTTLDPKMQLHVEDVLSRDDLYPTTIKVNMKEARAAIEQLPAGRDLPWAELQELEDETGGVAQPQAAVVLTDPITGEIRALGGGREYRKKVDEVLRFQTLRQPGSAIKPIIAYAPALEEGVLGGAASTLDDSPYIGPQGNWFPENFDLRFRGMITARVALYLSYNIPAVRAFEAMGPRVGSEYAQRMGISTLHPSEMDNLSLTLGGFTYGVSAIDMAQAYGVLANDGVRIDLHTVEKITDHQGAIIYEYRVNPRQVVSPEAAFITTDILRDFVRQYLGRPLQIDRPIAAKSGTTDDFRDVYLVAYTPNLVASFWMGYDEPRMGGIREGWRYSTIFLQEVLTEAFQDLEIIEFEQPEGIVRVSVCSRSGLLPNEYCSDAGTVVSDFFIAGQVPNVRCDMHEGRFYNRPPYIETDGRWTKGGAGRGPRDAEEMPPGGLFGEFGERGGQTTDRINVFRALNTENGVRLQWRYSGPAIDGFELHRSAHGNPDEDSTIRLDRNENSFSDPELTPNTIYTYSLVALYHDGSVSEPATVNVSTGTTFGSEGFGLDTGIGLFQRQDEGPVVVPNLVGVFQATAEGRIVNSGLKVGRVEMEYDEAVMPMQVISQRPEAGQVVPRGSAVSIVVAKRW